MSRGYNRALMSNEIDECYRTLATEIVRKAVEDYMEYMVRPNFAEELEAARELYTEARAIREIAKRVQRHDVEDLRSFLLRRIREVNFEGVYQPHKGCVNRLPGLIVKLERKRAMSAEELFHIAHTYYKVITAYYGGKYEKDKTRRDDAKICAEFLRSEDFIFYTGGLVDPEEVIAECERRVKSGLDESRRLQPLRFPY